MARRLRHSDHHHQVPFDYRWALAGAAVSVALLGLTWLVSFHAGFVQRADQRVFVAFYDLTFRHNSPRINDALHVFVALCSPAHYVYLAAFSVVLALARRAWAAACAACIVLAGANLTAQVLKAVLAEPRTASLAGVVVPVPYPRWPSGHSTAAMALVVALVLAVPPRFRLPMAGVGAAFAATVGCSVLAFGTHLPSDVVGGFLVASVWGFVAVAGLTVANGARADRETPAGVAVWLRQALGPPAIALALLAASVGIAAVSSPHAVSSYVGDHQLFVLGYLAIAVLSSAISTVVALSLRRSRV
jgi:membrane-associated phospholipid phosphatase